MGKIVEDITEHPILKLAALHAADRVYDHEKLGKISKFFKTPTNSQDLLERHKLIYDILQWNI